MSKQASHQEELASTKRKREELEVLEISDKDLEWAIEKLYGIKFLTAILKCEDPAKLLARVEALHTAKKLKKDREEEIIKYLDYSKYPMPRGARNAYCDVETFNIEGGRYVVDEEMKNELVRRGENTVIFDSSLYYGHQIVDGEVYYLNCNSSRFIPASSGFRITKIHRHDPPLPPNNYYSE